MPDLSIIIPIYNTPSAVLQRCFDSVSGLSGDISFEVLLVDDGSGPQVGAFCRDYICQHPSFRYIRQENGGASAARNTGIAHANGSYLTFLDADDTLLPACITPGLLRSDWDLVLFDMLLSFNSGSSVWHALDQSGGELTPAQLITRLICSKSLNSPCAKLFKRNIITTHQLRFDTGFVTGEDWNFVCDYALCIHRCFYEPSAVYCYYRDGSTSTGRLAKFPQKMLDNHLAMYSRKQALIPQLNDPDPTRLHSIVAADLIETLFNTAADLLLLGLLTADRKACIRQACSQASSVLATQASRKTRLKASILHSHFYLLRPMALLRKAYLKLNH